MMTTRQIRLISQMEEIKWNIETNQLNSVEILEHQQFKYAILLFSGPIDSPYEGFWFRIRFQWPEYYPFHPPRCILLDKVWNPYVDFQKNQLCIDILKNEWSPALRATQYILSIISLLSETKINESQNFMNPDAAIEMMKNYPYFYQHARKVSETSSFKKKEIYSDEMRGVPEEHNIMVQGNLIPQLISQNQNTNQYGKKTNKNYRSKQEQEKMKKQNQNQSQDVTKQLLKAEIESFRSHIIYNLQNYNSVQAPQ